MAEAPGFKVRAGAIVECTVDLRQFELVRRVSVVSDSGSTFQRRFAGARRDRRDQRERSAIITG
jgi:hypothetical protein